MPDHRLWDVVEKAATDCFCGLVSAWDIEDGETDVGAGVVARATLLIWWWWWWWWCWHGDAVAVMSLLAEDRVALVKNTEREAILVKSLVCGLCWWMLNGFGSDWIGCRCTWSDILTLRLLHVLGVLGVLGVLHAQLFYGPFQLWLSRLQD